VEVQVLDGLLSTPTASAPTPRAVHRYGRRVTEADTGPLTSQQEESALGAVVEAMTVHADAEMRNLADALRRSGSLIARWSRTADETVWISLAVPAGFPLTNLEIL